MGSIRTYPDCGNQPRFDSRLQRFADSNIGSNIIPEKTGKNVSIAIDVPVHAFKNPSPEELAHDYLRHNGQVQSFAVRRTDCAGRAATPATPDSAATIRQQRFGSNDSSEPTSSNVTWGKRHAHPEILSAHLAEREKTSPRTPGTTRATLAFLPGDLEKRKLRDQFLPAFDQILSRSSPQSAPWHIHPATRDGTATWPSAL